MSFSITEAFVNQYRDNVYHLAQQKGSRFRPFVRTEENVVGARKAFDRLAPTAAIKRTSRHSDTPLVNTPHSRRWANLDDYNWADLIDKLDKVKMLIDPTSDYAMAGANAMGRSMDDILITAMLGTAVTGETGSGTQSLPAVQKIAAAASGLTLVKLRSAKKLFNKAEVKDEPLYMAINAEMVDDLLADTTLTDADFNTVRVLANGQVNSFMGFNFIMSERLTLDTGGNRQAVAWAGSGVGLAIGQDVVARITERADKNHATQPYLCMSLGAVRIEDTKVVEIAVVE